MAVTGDYQFDLNGYTFGLDTSTSLTSISGLDMPEIDSNVSSAGNKHGASVTALFLKERVISLTGRINGTYDTMPPLRDLLKKAFAPVATDVPFTFRLPGYSNNNLFCNVKPQILRGDFSGYYPTVGVWEWTGTLLAGDPRIYGVASSTVNPLVGGATVTATNGGNFKAPTTIVFTGPLTNPKITNSTTGESFGVLKNLTSGQTLTIKSIDTTVILGSSTSNYSVIDPLNKTFIELAPGVNTLAFTATSGTGTASVQWRSTWI